ncbi:hypothetical protein SAMN05444405_10334 [Bacteroides luti]|jgi:hypothetical protein|uniref:Uncharacterized protein n=1 Tax=Bacteroides luti TaxID=1297750 RepID=A0A1M4WAL0_9BACE|nr:hypothetical protein SAMN05444405_10334 [Bacteroides luti]
MNIHKLVIISVLNIRFCLRSFKDRCVIIIPETKKWGDKYDVMSNF